MVAIQSDGQFHVFKAGQNSVTYHDQYSDGGGATYSEWSAPSRPLPRAPSSSPWSENSPPFVVSPILYCCHPPAPPPAWPGMGISPTTCATFVLSQPYPTGRVSTLAVLLLCESKEEWGAAGLPLSACSLCCG